MNSEMKKKEQREDLGDSFLVVALDPFESTSMILAQSILWGSVIVGGWRQTIKT